MTIAFLLVSSLLRLYVGVLSRIKVGLSSKHCLVAVIV